MSYEGEIELILENGQYTVIPDENTYFPTNFDNLPSPIKYWHAVDLTNGIDIDNPSTFPAPKRETGFFDIWTEDHYGNKYAIKVITYEPGSSPSWVKYKSET
jgi:hypothetical protein